MPAHKDIPPPELIKDRGSLHPINHMKDSIMELLISFGFELLMGLKLKQKNLILTCLILKNLILQGKCMTLFMLKINQIF
jgi:hypothetical protein